MFARFSRRFQAGRRVAPALTVVTSVYQLVSIVMEAGIVVMLLWRRAVLKQMVPEPKQS